MTLKWIKGYRTTPEIKIRTGKLYLFRNENTLYGIRVKEGVRIGIDGDLVPNDSLFIDISMLVPFPQRTQ